MRTKDYMRRRRQLVTAEQLAELVGTGEASRMIGVSVPYVQELCDSGKLASLRDTLGRRLVLKSSVEKFIERREARRAQRKAALVSATATA